MLFGRKKRGSRKILTASMTTSAADLITHFNIRTIIRCQDFSYFFKGFPDPKHD
jgi:hypothetical protein